MNFCGAQERGDRAGDLAGRAAVFRLEADVLRERARASHEPVIREHYAALAQRWTVFAASLEAELLTRALDEIQTTLL